MTDDTPARRRQRWPLVVIVVIAGLGLAATYWAVGPGFTDWDAVSAECVEGAEDLEADARLAACDRIIEADALSGPALAEIYLARAEINHALPHQSWLSIRADAVLATRADPLNRDAWVLLGAARTEFEQWSEAAEAFEAALDLEPDDPETNGLYGQALWRAGRPEDAATALRVAVDAQPEDLQLRLELAEALYDTADYAVVLDMAETVLAADGIEPQMHVVAQRMRATSLLHLGRFEDAEASARLVLEMSPIHQRAALVGILAPCLRGDAAAAWAAIERSWSSLLLNGQAWRGLLTHWDYIATGDVPEQAWSASAPPEMEDILMGWIGDGCPQTEFDIAG